MTSTRRLLPLALATVIAASTAAIALAHSGGGEAAPMAEHHHALAAHAHSHGAISANELTAVANSLQSTTFRAFEVYIVATIMYLAIAVAFRGFFAGVYWLVFVRGRER